MVNFPSVNTTCPIYVTWNFKTCMLKPIRTKAIWKKKQDKPVQNPDSQEMLGLSFLEQSPSFLQDFCLQVPFKQIWPCWQCKWELHFPPFSITQDPLWHFSLLGLGALWRHSLKLVHCRSVETKFNYSSMLNRSHVATIWNFDPNYSVSNVTQVSLPKMFQIVAMWLQFCTEE